MAFDGSYRVASRRHSGPPSISSPESQLALVAGHQELVGTPAHGLGIDGRLAGSGCRVTVVARGYLSVGKQKPGPPGQATVKRLDRFPPPTAARLAGSQVVPDAIWWAVPGHREACHAGGCAGSAVDVLPGL